MMTDQEWLDLYQKEYEEIPDEILDEADEYFGFTDIDNIDIVITDDWYIWVAKRYHGEI